MKMYEKNHELDEFFELKTVRFSRNSIEDKKKVEHFNQHVVCTNAVTNLKDKVIEKRQLDKENTLVRIGLDGDGGFLKVCMSIFNLSKTTSQKVSAKKFKDSGVKKVIIIAISPNIAENYVNIKKMWLNIGLHTMPRKFTILTDLKLCNILLGLISHSS